MTDPVNGEGYAVAGLEGLGEGYGFRKIRQALGVSAFGINAIVVVVGGKDGYIGRDGQAVGGSRGGPPGAA